MRFVSLILVSAVLLPSCRHGADREAPFSQFRCTLAQLPALIQPEPAMTFTRDTARMLEPWRASVGEPVVDRAGRACEDARSGLRVLGRLRAGCAAGLLPEKFRA